MTSDRLKSYQKNKRELAAVNQTIDRLEERLDNVEIVSGKVSRTSTDYPYIEEHVTVEVANPKSADPIRDKLISKRKRKWYLERELKAVEDYISGLEDGIEKEILELVYLDGMSQADAGDAVGYTQARVSQIIKDKLRGLDDK